MHEWIAANYKLLLTEDALLLFYYYNTYIIMDALDWLCRQALRILFFFKHKKNKSTRLGGLMQFLLDF